MIPVFDLKNLKSVPSTKVEREARMEMLRQAIEADDRYKQYCKDRGIVYVPCVAHPVHPMAAYCR